MSWPAAREALDARLTALPGIDPAKIAWPNFNLDPQKTLYWAANLLPAGVQPEMSGADHETGIYQVSIWTPNNTGDSAALVAAQAVVDWFKRQTFSGVSCGVPTLAPPIQQDDWWHIPVSIPFVCL